MGQGTIGEVPAALILPLPYMNDSGPVVAGALRWYHLGPELLVVHDDIDLPFGKLRIAAGRWFRRAQRCALGDAVGRAEFTDSSSVWDVRLVAWTRRLRAPPVRSGGTSRGRSAGR